MLDWSAYFFEPFQQLASLVLTDLPSYLNGAIYVDITGTGAPKMRRPHRWSRLQPRRH